MINVKPWWQSSVSGCYCLHMILPSDTSSKLHPSFTSSYLSWAKVGSCLKLRPVGKDSRRFTALDLITDVQLENLNIIQLLRSFGSSVIAIHNNRPAWPVALFQPFTALLLVCIRMLLESPRVTPHINHLTSMLEVMNGWFLHHAYLLLKMAVCL